MPQVQNSPQDIYFQTPSTFACVSVNVPHIRDPLFVPILVCGMWCTCLEQFTHESPPPLHHTSLSHLPPALLTAGHDCVEVMPSWQTCWCCSVFFFYTAHVVKPPTALYSSPTSISFLLLSSHLMLLSDRGLTHLFSW